MASPFCYLKKTATLLALCLIGLYQKCLSMFLPASCRFTPSCSEYAKEAVGRFGLIKGGLYAINRLCRCHPFAPWGADPVPSARSCEK